MVSLVMGTSMACRVLAHLRERGRELERARERERERESERERARERDERY